MFRVNMQLGFLFSGLGFRVSCFKPRNPDPSPGLMFRVNMQLGFLFSGLGFRVSCFKPRNSDPYTRNRISEMDSRQIPHVSGANSQDGNDWFAPARGVGSTNFIWTSGFGNRGRTSRRNTKHDGERQRERERERERRRQHTQWLREKRGACSLPEVGGETESPFVLQPSPPPPFRRPRLPKPLESTPPLGPRQIVAVAQNLSDRP